MLEFKLTTNNLDFILYGTHSTDNKNNRIVVNIYNWSISCKNTDLGAFLKTQGI